ncbi:MAG: hypothetical protein ACXWP5_14380 [Bdellovibrionota bacterium]
MSPKRILFYCFLPLFLLLAFVGVLPPVFLSPKSRLKEVPTLNEEA